MEQPHIKVDVQTRDRTGPVAFVLIALFAIVFAVGVYYATKMLNREAGVLDSSVRVDMAKAEQIRDTQKRIDSLGVDGAVDRGLIRKVGPYYPQPDFQLGRYLKVEDQFGCKWWTSADSTVGDLWVVLKDGKPDCPEPEHRPPPSVHYVDRDGNIIF